MHSVLKKNLGKQGDNACYILITCQHPAPDGVMQVKMSYEGDATLASYLLQGAQSYIDEEGDHSCDRAIPILDATL
ncbi:MAG: hypothetical protein E6Q59_03675 [Nitrosomonas sp.]|nr:MAG: hypothetical protein E6Q59_03675 [Nitrosomonas sp.]